MHTYIDAVETKNKNLNDFVTRKPQQCKQIGFVVVAVVNSKTFIIMIINISKFIQENKKKMFAFLYFYLIFTSSAHSFRSQINSI